MQEKIKAFKVAFPYTLPVMTGYLFLGMAFGILLNSKGYHFGWAILMSVFIYAGSMQYVAINLLTIAFNPLNAFIMTLMVNARHLFYGLSLLGKFGESGRKKPYLMFGLTDETFSILCASNPPPGVDRGWFMFFITVLNHSYWIIACALGGILGSLVSFNTRGIDFVMTALFVVIFLEQWKSQKQHAPALIGIGASVLSLLVFGPANFIIPSMILIILVFTLLRRPLENLTSLETTDKLEEVG
ncbi:putative branched-chain amino acid permease (azaleucine resistance) [Desulfitobacterium dichloroeliminans LMG P-21439]|uniref:Putative branched-chain amino acid permease (Azaleucine resistance) n=1 Tax=Desulfitobacterium dichloroeliminans (strain LMG P-21439 / DCA1) TaxID=871963 RepID=L0FAB5_DESDL|nr:AzlC family ABC transporter permease [Desulfitobacterium dichloroeliminans]AGA69888.1 putative branched-chain amino acid permease (azaleucine resistance) [Desulfitobacterium dichloroeliminans LMG P-21439]